MAQAEGQTHDAARSLRVALDHVGDALSEARLDDLLAAESSVLAAIQAMPDTAPEDPVARLALRRELDRVRVSLMRCRRLGVSLGTFVRASQQAQGTTGEYDRSGQEGASELVHALNTRV